MKLPQGTQFVKPEIDPKNIEQRYTKDFFLNSGRNVRKVFDEKRIDILIDPDLGFGRNS